MREEVLKRCATFVLLAAVAVVGVLVFACMAEVARAAEDPRAVAAEIFSARALKATPACELEPSEAEKEACWADQYQLVTCGLEAADDQGDCLRDLQARAQRLGAALKASPVGGDHGTGFRLLAGALARYGWQGSKQCRPECHVPCSVPLAGFGCARIPSCTRFVDLLAEVEGDYPYPPSVAQVFDRFGRPNPGCQEVGESNERGFLNALALECECTRGTWGFGWDCQVTNQERWDLAFTTPAGQGPYRCLAASLPPPVPKPRCGDGKPDPGETCETCPQDVGACPPPPPQDPEVCIECRVECPATVLRRDGQPTVRQPGTPGASGGEQPGFKPGTASTSWPRDRVFAGATPPCSARCTLVECPEVTP